MDIDENEHGDISPKLEGLDKYIKRFRIFAEDHKKRIDELFDKN